MAKIDWKFKDEVGTNLNRYKATNVNTGEEKTLDLVRNANITTSGTLLNAQNLNVLIDAINSNANNIEGNGNDIADLQDYTDEINNKVSTNTNDISNLKKQINTSNTNIANKTPYIEFTSSTTANSTIDRVKTFMEELVGHTFNSYYEGEVFTCKIKMKSYSPYCFLASVLEVQQETFEVAMLDLQTLDYYWGTVREGTTQGNFYVRQIKRCNHFIQIQDSTAGVYGYFAKVFFNINTTYTGIYTWQTLKGYRSGYPASGYVQAYMQYFPVYEIELTSTGIDFKYIAKDGFATISHSYDVLSLSDTVVGD